MVDNNQNGFYLRVKRLRKFGRLDLPKRVGDCGHDVYSAKEVIIPPHGIFNMPLGVSIEIPSGYYAWVQERSSIGLTGIRTVSNIIDSGYRGEIHAVLLNTTHYPITIKKNQRVAQIIFQKYATTPEIIYVDQLSESERSHCGFGSTDDTDYDTCCGDPKNLKE